MPDLNLIGPTFLLDTESGLVHDNDFGHPGCMDPDDDYGPLVPVRRANLVNFANEDLCDSCQPAIIAMILERIFGPAEETPW